MKRASFLLMSAAILPFDILVTCLFAQLANSPWPMFHHDVGHTGLSEYAGPSIPALS